MGKSPVHSERGYLRMVNSKAMARALRPLSVTKVPQGRPQVAGSQRATGSPQLSLKSVRNTPKSKAAARFTPKRSSAALHSPVHGLVRQAVGVLILVAQGMHDLEFLQLRDLLLRLLVQRPQPRALHLVLALDLLDHQLRVGDDPQPLVAMFKRKIERRQKPRILRKFI